MFRVWTKLQRIAHEAQQIQKEYSSVDKKLLHFRERLQEIQASMITDLFNQQQIEDDREMLKMIENWEGVHEKILRQQSRAVWIKHGDRNSKYFFAFLKARQTE